MKFEINKNMLTVPCRYIFKSVYFVRKSIVQLEENRPHTFNPREMVVKYRFQYTNQQNLKNQAIVYNAITFNTKLPDVINLFNSNKTFHEKIKTLSKQKCYYSTQEYLDYSFDYFSFYIKIVSVKNISI